VCSLPDSSAYATWARASLRGRLWNSSILLTRAAELAMRYVNGVSERRVAPAEAAVAALRKFHEPFVVCGKRVPVGAL